MSTNTKQRELTPKQRTLLEMDMAGATDQAIATALSIHVGTVRAKRTALRRGIAKSAYSNIINLITSSDVTTDLFIGAVLDNEQTL